MKFKKLGDLTKIKTGKLNANAAIDQGEYPFFTCSNNTLTINSYSYDCECVLVAGNGDLNVKYYNGKFDAYQRTYIIESLNTNILDNKYLYYFLKQYVNQLRSESIGGVIKYIKLGNLTNAIIPLVSKKEQLQIIKALETANKLGKLRQQQITALSNLKQSIFYDMFGDPQLNTKKWKKGRIRDLTAFTQYGSSKKASETEGQYPILRMNNITYEGELVLDNLKFIDLDEKEKTKYLVSKGDLLFNRTNSKELVGKTAVYDKNDPVAYAGYLVKLVPNNLANAHFISGYLNSNYGKRYLFNMAKNIVGMANINAKELQSIPIIIPPKKLQDEYENKLKEIIIRIEVMKNSLKHYENLYNSLMQKAFKGELFQDEDTNCR
ncbi:restriction endonuclease subunit S [Virgibacillus dokdonensis]|uniref:restriction endonuclease subunit S n=1 Tax=Virgibacillus dokdonensis TaxID=302167 RepID=UPI000989E8C5|nr:restriction endonuclease subunit S [Virgibacillus dokdonensis]